jgi:hypothetical protein
MGALWGWFKKLWITMWENMWKTDIASEEPVGAFLRKVFHNLILSTSPSSSP